MLQVILIPVCIVGGLGLIFGVGLAYASKKFEVKVDKRIADIKEMLPGANCGACGYTGCEGFAEALVEGKADINGCPVGGAELAKKLTEVLGEEVSAGTEECKVARVMCKGDENVCKIKYNYAGIMDCAAAESLHGGPSACAYGCLGMGDCVKACPFDAIIVENGVARVITSKCTGCGKCTEACPKNIIELVPYDKQYTVSCSNPDKGNKVIKVCKVGCIGCRKCAKACESDAIQIDGFIAKINPEKCTNCGECIKVCPTKAIDKYPICDYEEDMAVNE